MSANIFHGYNIIAYIYFVRYQFLSTMMEIYQLVPILMLSINIWITNILIMITLDPVNIFAIPCLTGVNKITSSIGRNTIESMKIGLNEIFVRSWIILRNTIGGGPDTGRFKHNMG